MAVDNFTQLSYQIDKLQRFRELFSNKTPAISDTLTKLEDLNSKLKLFKQLDQDQLETLEKLFSFYYSTIYVLIGISLFAVQLNLLLSILIAWACHNRLLSRKRYIFIASRTVSDTINAALTLVWSLLDLNRDSRNNFLNHLHIVQVSLSFWSVTGTCLGLAAVTWLAVRKPLYYRTQVTLKRCFQVIVVIWLFTVGYTVFITPIGGSVFFSYKSQICSQFCQLLLTIIAMLSFILSYLSVPVFYVGIMITLCRRFVLFPDAHIMQMRHYWRLGLSIGSYTIFNSAFAFLTAVALLLLFSSETDRSEMLKTTTRVFALRLVAMLLMTSRTLVDPLLMLLQDYSKIRQIMRARQLSTSVPRRHKQGRCSHDNMELQALMPAESMMGEPAMMWLHPEITLSTVGNQTPKKQDRSHSSDESALTIIAEKRSTSTEF